MNGVIIMKEKDLEKIKIKQLLLKKQISQIQASKQLRLSDRQILNIFKKYQEFGDKGVISKQARKPSNRQLSNDLKIRVCSHF